MSVLLNFEMAHFGHAFRIPRVNVMKLCTYTVATLMVINMSMPPPSSPPPILPFVMVTDMVLHHEYRKKKRETENKTRHNVDIDEDFN